MSDLDESMIDWIRSATGAVDVEVERRSAGASRAGFTVDAILADGSVRHLWLRMDLGSGPQSGGLYSLRREAAVYRALQGHGVRIASIVAVHPTEEAFLMDRLYGRNWFSEVDDADRAERLAREFMDQLATLHRIDVANLDLPELGRPSRVSDHVRVEIDEWEGQYRDQGRADPLIELALSWLRNHLPDDGDWPVVLVQGDTGPGNFMFDDDHVVAVTDWELAHWGDLHDDLGWIYVRDLQERFTHLPDRVSDYERALGRRVDVDRLRYFRALAQTRCAIGTLNGLLSHDARGEMANHLIYNGLHMRLLADALADASGVSEPAAGVAEAPDTDRTWAYDIALDDLRHQVVPAIDDAFASRRAKGLARLLKYLKEADRLSPLVDAAERADLSEVLGHDVESLTEARAELCEAIAAGTVDELRTLSYCRRREARRTQVLTSAMGALAQRSYAPLPA